MKAHEARRTDCVVDAEGSVWVFDDHRRGWRYLTTEADEATLSPDARDELPDTYEPYVMLDASAAAAIRTYRSMLPR
jgi:hypothetical protein